MLVQARIAVVFQAMRFDIRILFVAVALHIAVALLFVPKRSACVITSYSIHYTKLYEFPSPDSTLNPPSFPLLYPDSSMLLTIFPVVSDSVCCRITSYNVCYTKLLRLKELESTNKQATKEQKAILAKYKGWGGLANVFAYGNYNAKAELKKILTEEDRITSYNVCYTKLLRTPTFRGRSPASRAC